MKKYLKIAGYVLIAALMPGGILIAMIAWYMALRKKEEEEAYA